MKKQLFHFDKVESVFFGSACWASTTIQSLVKTSRSPSAAHLVKELRTMAKTREAMNAASIKKLKGILKTHIIFLLFPPFCLLLCASINHQTSAKQCSRQGQAKIVGRQNGQRTAVPIPTVQPIADWSGQEHGCATFNKLVSADQTHSTEEFEEEGIRKSPHTVALWMGKGGIHHRNGNWNLLGWIWCKPCRNSTMGVVEALKLEYKLIKYGILNHFFLVPLSSMLSIILEFAY